MSDTVVLVTAVGLKKADAGPRLLPADRQLPGEDLRRGPHPRRLLQARGPPDREGDADLAPDRPADPAAVSGRLHQRRAGRRLGAVGQLRGRSRHRLAARRLGGAGDLRHAVHGPDRRGARRLQGRQVPAESDRDAARRLEARPGRRRHRGRRADGRVRGRRPRRGRDARRGRCSATSRCRSRSRRSTSWSPRPASRSGPGRRRSRTPS